MLGYRIQIIKAKLDSYWYASCTGNTYWAIKHDTEDGYQDFRAIEEGIIPIGGLGKKYIDINDVLVIKEATIRIDTEVTIKVIEIQ